MRNGGYSITDKKIDAYLGTRNLRPGPPARLINKILDGADKTDPTEAQRINFSSFAKSPLSILIATLRSRMVSCPK